MAYASYQPYKSIYTTSPGWGNAATVAKKKNPAVATAGPSVTQPTNPGWGANPLYPGYTEPVKANDLNQIDTGYKFDVPGTAANPSPPGTGNYARPEYDMNNAIETDWETIAAKKAADEMNNTGLTNLQKALRQAYIDYGGGGGDLGEWAEYIDPDTIARAKANKFSTLAMNRRNYDYGSAQTKADMAARGGLGSGDTINALKSLLFGREQADYGGFRTFAGGAQQGLTGLQSIRQQAQAKIDAARSNAAPRAAANAPVSDDAIAAGEAAVAAGSPAAAAAATGKYTWDNGAVSNITQLKAWLKARGRTLASFQQSNPAAYAKLAAQ
jgi:hypothetical protein